mmetsp:Transcript_13655/g.54068  ORF Transcript_13655/g.54068 Transcript_13655/m.54068 type:complete len:156 (-) Transcript_13655:50-517(-)
MYLFDPDSRERLHCWLGHSSGKVSCLTICGNRLWSSAGNQITVWEYLADTKQMMRHFSGKLHSHRITCLLGAEGRVWSCGYDYRILLWDGESFEVILELDWSEGKELARCAVASDEGCVIGASCRPDDGLLDDDAFVGKFSILQLATQPRSEGDH